MTGVILNHVEVVVRADRGDHTWDGILDDTGASAAHTSLGSCPDGDVVDLFYGQRARGERPSCLPRCDDVRVLRAPSS